MIQDLRFGLRMLLKNRLFTLVAILSLALGIGANTAIFSLINTLMLKRLPVEAPGELALFSIVRERGPQYSFNYPLYEMFRDQNQSFSGVITTAGGGRTRVVFGEGGGAGAVEMIDIDRVSGNFFSVLGVKPVLGRVLTETDDRETTIEPGAVISFEYWKRRFGQDPGVLGRKLTVNEIPLTIVGVAPPGFFGAIIGNKPDLWQGLKTTQDLSLKRKTSWWMRVLGRVRPGVSREQAQAEADTIYRRQLDELVAEEGKNWTPLQRQRHYEGRLTLESGAAGFTYLRMQFKQPLMILMTVVGLVLAIACVNIANLLLARAGARRKEIAVRLALGASRGRLLRQLLTESVLLSLVGGVAGLLFSAFCTDVLIAYLPERNQNALRLAPDAIVLMFTLGVSVATGLLFGLAPALQATRLDLTGSLKEQSGSSAGRNRLALNKLLVVAQVALSLFLLIGAGLFVRSLQNLRALDAGFNPTSVVQFLVDAPKEYKLSQAADVYRQLLTRLEALPGVHSATMSSFSFLSGNTMTNEVVVPGYSNGPDENMSCHFLRVGPKFFETMKTPLLAGRDFGPQDERPVVDAQDPKTNPQAPARRPSPAVAVINQTMARYFWGDQNPIGKQFKLEDRDGAIEVIGVVKDAKYTTLREAAPRTFYFYYPQSPDRYMTIQFRTEGDETSYASTIGRMLREIDPQLQVERLRTMSDVVDESIVQERFTAHIVTAFSVFALLLACIGLYGVMSYAVARRTNEIGLRMALGAQAGNVVWLVMREVLLLVAIGVALGLAGAYAATRLVSTLLFGLNATDPMTILLSALVMLGVAALAGYLPARRASRIDPMVALRYE